MSFEVDPDAVRGFMRPAPASFPPIVPSPWPLSSLSARLEKLPQVICGPVLRQVTPRSVTVWIVLRNAAAVTLKVNEVTGGNATLISPPAKRATTAIGTHLHMVAVTARWAQDKLGEGKLYSYDLEFDFDQPVGNPAVSHMSLSQATLASDDMREFAYSGFSLPTFVLPPANLEKLRLIHGSCRKPNGGVSGRKKLPDKGSPDMLAVLDDLIEAKAGEPLERPHQLFLSGDQIYSDEVADVLLLLLTDAGDVLLGWEEKLPGLGSSSAFAAKTLEPATRASTFDSAGFTTSDRRSHLMSLGEYLSMYLFAWSPVLWPKVLPDLIDVPLPDEMFKLADQQKEQRLEVEAYASTLTKVRRALANVPSYMICDDHEITDDWNMTREFCEQVYGKPLGMRIMQNGMLAYALCQAWGNLPEQFEDHAANPAGLKLLRKLAGVNAATYDSQSKDIQKIVGLQDAAALAAFMTGAQMYAVQHVGGATVGIRDVFVNDGTLRYNYSVEGPGHQVIVTDTRTWRSWPRDGAVEQPDLLSVGEIGIQVGGAPSLGKHLQIIVVSTNMPNIPPARAAEALLNVLDSKVYEYDLYDAWSFPSLSFDRLIAELADRQPQDNSTPPANSGRVVILSGDVHSSYANRLAFWRKRRPGDSPNNPRPAQVVFAQLVSSALKNESQPTIGQHHDGYGYAPHWYAEALLPPQIEEGVYGWAFNPGSTQGIQVGKQQLTIHDINGDINVEVPFFVNPQNPSVHHHSMNYFKLKQSARTTITTPPDYEYRVDQIHASALGQALPPPPNVASVGSGTSAASRKAALDAYDKAAAAYRRKKKHAAGTSIVGRNNISEITFTWGTGEDKAVHHTVMWKDPGASKLSWARFTVPLGLNDSRFKPVPL